MRAIQAPRQPYKHVNLCQINEYQKMIWNMDTKDTLNHFQWLSTQSSVTGVGFESKIECKDKSTSKTLFI